MNILGNMVYMIILAAIISFFVAFVINTIYQLMQLIKKGEEDPKTIPTIQLSTIQKEAKSGNKNDEIIAVISYALHLYLSEMHDLEKMRMTINKTVRPYSPWSSKIYGLNRYWR